MFRALIAYIKDRLREPSTWCGLIALIAAEITKFTPDNIDVIVEALSTDIQGLIKIIFRMAGVALIFTPSNVKKK